MKLASLTVKGSPLMETRTTTSSAPNLVKSGDLHVIASGDWNAPETLASRLPSALTKRIWTIGDSTKRKPCSVIGVPPVRGPVCGSARRTAYGGPAIPATLSVHKSDMYFWRQPPKKRMLHVAGSYAKAQSSRAPGAEPATIGATHELDRTSMMPRWDEYSRGAFCPPKTKSLSEGTELTQMAW